MSNEHSVMDKKDERSLDPDIRAQIVRVDGDLRYRSAKVPSDIVACLREESELEAEAARCKASLFAASSDAQNAVAVYLAAADSLAADRKAEEETVKKALEIIPCPDSIDQFDHEHFVASLVFGRRKIGPELVEEIRPAGTFRFKLSEEDVLRFPRLTPISDSRVDDVRQKGVEATEAAAGVRDAVARLDDVRTRLAKCRHGLDSLFCRSRKLAEQLGVELQRERASVEQAFEKQERRDREGIERIRTLREEADALARKYGQV